MSIDSDIEQRLDDIEEKVDDSYKILCSIKRKQTFDFWFSIVKILVFIGAFYSIYVFIEPILNQLKEAYVSFQGLKDSVPSLNGINVWELLKQQPK